METHAMEGAVISQLTSAAMVVYFLQFLKNTAWYPRFAAWLPIDDANVHRAVSILGAFISAVGVHIAFTGSAAAGWHFIGTIPPLAVLGHSLWDLGQQFALNQLTYDAVAKRSNVMATLEQLLNALKSAGAGVKMVLVVGLCSAALVLTSACASTPPLQRATIGETAAVLAVHTVVTAEQTAYASGAYSQATHDKYLRALKQVTDGEQALNDALLAWAHVDGQPMPAAVATAVKSLAGVLKDLQPLIPTNSTAATLANAIVGAISQLTGA